MKTDDVIYTYYMLHDLMHTLVDNVLYKLYGTTVTVHRQSLKHSEACLSAECIIYKIL